MKVEYQATKPPKPAQPGCRHPGVWSLAHHCGARVTERGGGAGAPTREHAAQLALRRMGLQSFEHGLERMVEGVFARGSRSTIRPVELGRRLLREIDDHRSVDVRGRRIVPNVFTFTLSAKDHAGFADIDEALVAELGETAREYARAENYHFMGPVTVEMLVDNNLKPGRFGVMSRMKESGGGAGAGSVILPSGERITIGQRAVSVGRLPECTVPVGDANVSRKHCEIRPAGGGFVVVDLGSTNGTKVNGMRIQGEYVLADGDIVSVGNTHLRFEAS
jgi:hypothetical protein